MSQSIVALDLIRRSLYLINAFASGETIDDVSANDALSTLNEMIDSWSTEELAVYGIANREFNTVVGQSKYAIDVGGNFNMPRPVYIQEVYGIRLGVTSPIELIPQERWNRVAVKATRQPVPDVANYVNSFPAAEIEFYPVPSEVITIGMSFGRVLTTIPNLQTVISLPEGYLRALRYCLAVDLWPEYSNQSTDINTIKSIAIKAKTNIKIANIQDIEMNFSSVPGVDTSRSWDWRGG